MIPAHLFYFFIFNCFCVEWSTGLHWFWQLNRAQKNFLTVFFKTEMLGFQSTRLFVWLKITALLHIIKHLTALDSKILSESILEESIQIVHMLLGETMRPDFVATLQRFPNVNCDICKRVKSAYNHRTRQGSILC